MPRLPGEGWGASVQEASPEAAAVVQVTGRSTKMPLALGETPHPVSPHPGSPGPMGQHAAPAFPGGLHVPTLLTADC